MLVYRRGRALTGQKMQRGGRRSIGDAIVQRDLVPLLLGRPGGRAVTEERAMQQPDSKSAITRDRYDAVLLDLDGVITDTANIHATCWKQMFDAYLRQRAADTH